MSMNARPYAHSRGARDFAYAFGAGFCDRDNRLIRATLGSIKVSCINTSPLSLGLDSSPDSTLLQVATITCALSDLAKLDTISANASTTNSTSENLTTLLYELCVREGILLQGREYLFTALELDSGAHSPLSKQFKVFALDLARLEGKKSAKPHAKRPSYENLSAQIFIPLIMLPLGQNTAKSPVSGVFLLDDWLAFYRDGKLAYECRCENLAALQDALGFIASIHGHENREIFYPADLLPKALESSSLESSLESHELDSATLESNPHTTQSTAPESKADSSALDSSPLDSTQRAPNEIDKIIFTPMPHSLARLADDLLHTDEYEPLYNPYAKPIFQSASARSALGLIACCAMILALPFGKLIYAEHLSAQAQSLAAQNAQVSQTIAQQKQLAATLPAQSAKITQTIESLSAMHAKYTPRLHILSTLSSLVRDAGAWIVDLSLTSQLDRGETLLTLSCHGLKEESLHTLLSTLKSTPSLEVISAEPDKELANGFGMSIALKILHV